MVPLADELPDAPPGSAGESVAALLFRRLPATDPGATKRNIAVLLAYSLGVAVVVGQVVATLS